MNELRKQLLEELIEQAYAERGYDVALTEEETDQLVSGCIEQVEAMSYPQPPIADREGTL
jgi:hypothetical protein